MKKLFLFSVTILCIFSCSLFADLVYFDDGLSHTIDDDTYSNSVIFLDKNIVNEHGTHLEVNTGANVVAVEAYNNSTMNITDGRFEGVVAYNNSMVNINGGIFTHGIGGGDNSVVTLSRAQSQQLTSVGDSTITVSDNAFIWIVHPSGNSSVTFNGGFIGHFLIAEENSVVSIKGGDFYEHNDLPPNFESLSPTTFVATEQSTIYLYGSSFSAGGMALEYGDNLRDFGTVDGENISAYITGVLADGSLLNNHFGLSDEANIIIIPEPATFLLFGLGGLVLRRHRK